MPQPQGVSISPPLSDRRRSIGSPSDLRLSHDVDYHMAQARERRESAGNSKNVLP